MVVVKHGGMVMKRDERCQELRDEVRQEGLISVQLKKKKPKLPLPPISMVICMCVPVSVRVRIEG